MSLLRAARRLAAENRERGAFAEDAEGKCRRGGENLTPKERGTPFAENAENPPKKTSANLQPTETIRNEAKLLSGKPGAGPLADEKTDPRKAPPVLDSLDLPNFASKASCAREIETRLLPLFNIQPPLSLSPSRAREANSAKLPAIIPDACPVWEWRWTPGVERACAFGKELLQNLAAAGTVPDDEGRCPLLRACKLVCIITPQTLTGGAAPRQTKEEV